MNTQITWQVWSSLFFCISSIGCASEVRAPERTACADYGALTTALAEATVRCTGTIGPESFVVKGGLLQKTFTDCTIEVEAACKQNPDQECPRQTVAKLLELQNFHSALPRYQQCLTDRYTRWTELFERTELKACPMWKDPKVIGGVSRAGSAQLARMRPKLNYVEVREGKQPGTAVYTEPVPVNESRLPPPSTRHNDQRLVDIQVRTKSSILYNIAYSSPEAQAQAQCKDPAVCAAQCAAFLPGFVVSAGGNQLLADPASWFREDNFNSNPCWNALSPDPYCPQQDFVHQMSVNSTSDGITVPPGDLYGDPNRANIGEHCDRWRSATATSPGFDYETNLVLECTDTTKTICLSRCGN